MIIILRFMNPFKEEISKNGEENKESLKQEKVRNMEDKNDRILSYMRFLKNGTGKRDKVNSLKFYASFYCLLASYSKTK